MDRSVADGSELGPVMHIAFFWLREDATSEDHARLLGALRRFGEIDAVRSIFVGVPDPARQRDVVDSSYSASIVMTFDDEAGYLAHIEHPVHHDLGVQCGDLIARALVYDPTPAGARDEARA